MRLLPWVAAILYFAVLVAGVYFTVAGLSAAGPLSAAGFSGLLGVLLALELVERRRFGLHTPPRLAVGLLAARILLLEAVGALDAPGFSRVLYLLVPFTAYFSLGRKVSYALAAGYLVAVVVKLSFVPGWYANPERVSDLLMFVVGMVFAVSMAAVGAEAEASRARAEAYAGQVAELAAITERNRLARDIHDSLGHHLTAIAVQLEKATAFRQRDPAASQQALADARRATQHALRDVRQSVGQLRDGGAFSLPAALAELVAGDHGFTVTLAVSGEETGYRRPALLALYRAAQEGLTNVHKHAAARRVTVRVTFGDDCAHLLVEDDGCGFAVDSLSTVDNSAGNGVPHGRGGYGLRGMLERLELVGGSLQVDAAPGRGTRLLVTVPRDVR